MRIPFGEFAPDQADQNTNVATQANNCLSGVGGYLPLPSEGSARATLSSNLFPRHAVSYSGNAWTDPDSTNAEIVIYKYSGLSLIVHTKYIDGGASVLPTKDISGTTTTLIDRYEHGYPFTFWGKAGVNYLILAGGGCVPQKINTATLPSGSLTDLGDSPPVAFTCAVVRDFLVLGGTYDTGTTTFFPNRVQWSGFNDIDSWTAGTNQSDFQDLQGGGEITRVVGGEVGIIFQSDSVTRMTYIGSPAIFQFDEIDSAVGCLAGNSVVSVGTDIYYLSRVGFSVLRNGSGFEQIGVGRVDGWFNDNIGDQTGTSKEYQIYRDVRGCYDRKTNCIFWVFPLKDNDNRQSISGTGTTLYLGSKYIIYNLTTGKWSAADPEQRVYCIFNSIPEIVDSGDGFIPTDSDMNLLAYKTSSSFDIKRFEGTAKTATLETGEFSEEDALTQITEVRPIVDGSCTVTMSTRDKLSDTATDGSATSLDSTGKANVRTLARYNRVKVTTSGDFTQAVGVEVKAKKRGRR